MYSKDKLFLEDFVGNIGSTCQSYDTGLALGKYWKQEVSQKYGTYWKIHTRLNATKY